MNIYVIVFDAAECTGYKNMIVGQVNLGNWLKDTYTSGLFIREFSPSGVFIGEKDASYWKLLLTA